VERTTHGSYTLAGSVLRCPHNTPRDFTDSYVGTALRVAVENYSDATGADIVEALLKAGADANLSLEEETLTDVSVGEPTWQRCGEKQALFMVALQRPFLHQNRMKA